MTAAGRVASGVVPVLVTLWLSDFRTTASAQQEIVTLATRPGVTQSYFLTSIPRDLRAVAILFAGSGGLIQLRNENGKQVKYPFNFKEALKGAHPEQNIVLQPGDTIVVP